MFSVCLKSGPFPLFCVQVAQKVCVMFQQCKQGKLAEVRQQISQLVLKKASGRAKATPIKSPTEDAEDSDDDHDEEVCPKVFTFFLFIYFNFIAISYDAVK